MPTALPVPRHSTDMSAAKLTEFETTIIGYAFADPSLAWDALTAPGSPRSFVFRPSAGHGYVQGGLTCDGNTRLAILGDKIMDAALTADWLKTGASKAALSSIIQRVACNANLDRLGNQLGLDRFVLKNPSQGAWVPTKVMTATMEAILGAVWLDCGGDIEIVKGVMARLGLVAPLAQDGHE